MAELTYLDNNATTQPLPEVVEAMREALSSDWANPSSIHRLGAAARRKVELARESVARLLGCQERELLLCSGGTESANYAILGSLTHFRESEPTRRLLLTSRLEHSAVRETADAWQRAGGEVMWAVHTASGAVDLDWFARTLSEHGSRLGLVSLMWANNETGVVAPIERIGALCRDHDVRFHTDATQWVGRMPVDVSALQVDLLTFAAHKFHGPKGVGGLYIRRGVRLARQIHGGPQERDRRGGTENVPGIVGMGVAADAARAWFASGSNADERPHAAPAALRDSLEREVLTRCPGSSVNGADAPRLWTTSNIAFPKLEAEAILLLLSERGLCASAGAACSSGSLDPSPVLLAMGIPHERAHGSVRFSLSRFTTAADIERAIEIVPAAIERLSRSTSALR